MRSLAFLLAASVLATIAAPVERGMEGLDAYVETVMKEWKVPGLALAVVRDGKLIHSRGYGLRDLRNDLPVTEKTLFGIGSITKSFTALALATLVEEGKLDWDRPVRDYLPDFRLRDAVATERATTRDLLTHRTGLPRHDSVWAGGIRSRREMYETIRFLDPSRDFRASFQYNNLMYMTAGYLAGHIAGSTWEELVRAKILDRLAMQDTNFSVTSSEKTSNWARTYRETKGALNETPLAVIDALGPAGSINSTLEDMTRYLRMHLALGELNGVRIVTERSATEMQTPQITVPAGAMPGVWDHLGATSYGLGLELGRYRGEKIVFHTGTIGGYHALFTFLPDRKTGLVMMLNRVERTVPPSIACHVYDLLLGVEPRDWLKHYVAWSRQSRDTEGAERKAVAAKRKKGTKPSHLLAQYAGEYSHPAYGVMKVEARDGNLTWARGSRSGTLSHFHYDVFEMSLLASSLRIRFFTNVDGEVDQLAAKLEPSAPEIVFTRTRSQ